MLPLLELGIPFLEVLRSPNERWIQIGRGFLPPGFFTCLNQTGFVLWYDQIKLHLLFWDPKSPTLLPLIVHALGVHPRIVGAIVYSQTGLLPLPEFDISKVMEHILDELLLVLIKARLRIAEGLVFGRIYLLVRDLVKLGRNAGRLSVVLCGLCHILLHSLFPSSLQLSNDCLKLYMN